MDLQDLKTSHFLFNCADFGRIFVFVDFGNVRPWAKDLWPEENKFRLSLEIDIKKLANVCDWVKPTKKFFLNISLKTTLRPCGRRYKYDPGILQARIAYAMLLY